MVTNRALRRVMKANAKEIAARMARRSRTDTRWRARDSVRDDNWAKTK